MIGGRYGEKKFCVVVTGNENFSHIGGMIQTMKRKGFTLVELLIVIVVIGILSAMMMLSSTEAVSSARANNIVSNLRNLKTAALAFYIDSMDVTDGKKITDIGADKAFYHIKRHLNNEAEGNFDGYSVVNGEGTDWYLKVTVNDSRVKEKLASRAASVGLLKAAQKPTTADKNTYVASGSDVYMFVR